MKKCVTYGYRADSYRADRRNGTHVTLLGFGSENTLLTPEPSQQIVNHSDSFNWGDGGSDSAQLALAILLDVTDDAEFARRVYQDFKSDVIAHLPDQWDLQRVDIEHWIKNIKNLLVEGKPF